MVCDLLDLRCIFVSELVGSAFLASVIGVIAYFMIASKNRWGFDTTIGIGLPMILIIGLAFTGFSTIMAFSIIIVGFLIAWLYSKIMSP